MAQAGNVTNITKKDGETRHADNLLLTMVSAWKLARAEARVAWAKYDYESKFSTRDAATDVPYESLDRVAECEQHLTQFEPKSTLGVKVLIDAALDIMVSHKMDPESTFGSGPALEILLSVSSALAAAKDHEI